ncbi:MAG TPA: BON domain-containing protein [Pyrinomonadaceae bacterium]|jgi:hyperosmotically inducible protein|nr:BON domain-containing protein [Pyrinomonadaceae bacterium]
MKTIKHRLFAIIAVVAIAASAALAGPTQNRSRQQIIKQVQHELRTLPYYGVFDNLSYKVEGSTVTLYGQVVQPTTRSDAGRRVARIQGVLEVVNNIEVLPLSSFDDAVRQRTYRMVFSRAGLYRYAMGADPSVHIVVNHGHVTLEGVVDSRMDSQLAYNAALGVPGVFSVTNHLRVAGQENVAN